MTTYPTRKPAPRLPGFNYVGAYGYFVTINSHQRQSVFSGAPGVECIDTLVKTAEDAGFDLMAYCLMPDHLHLLCTGRTEGAQLGPFVKLFKQVTGFQYKKATGRQLWQRGYYDHVLRSDEDAHDIAAYIWYNPVRAGLVSEPGAYSFSGPPGRIAPPQADRAEALSLQWGPLFAKSAAMR
jgi:REP element-mobilizing transposase RayT